MHRRLALWFGSLLLALIAGFLAVFGRDAIADPGTAVLISGLVAAATLSIVGGTVESITIGPRTLRWNVLLGAADVVLAAVVILSGLRAFGTGGTDAGLFAVAASIGGLSLAWFGLQIAREGRHIELEPTPSRGRVVGTAALVVASVVAGLLVTTVV
ncbi:hypothetical protein [Natronorubrum texcoconense]|uniref:Uncharacterized protein n=1 Tax=Natronorubrum texcoconense TaxID=1095776 RepID=A0A1G9ETR0_9EURY|nr:hypothetical protein [Natronorubrum texcoconense]SDK79552.1 hypothetical protein SAMN04515672_3977 [Natronorubrum texcoconense]